jgi:hypothetical protein
MTDATIYETALARARALDDDEDSRTWLDADPEVAWGCEPGESYLASLRAIYESVGWEGCYHRDGRLHFDVKIRNSYPSLNRALDKLNLSDDDARERIEQRMQDDGEFELEIFWQENIESQFLDRLQEDNPSIVIPPKTKRHNLYVYQCGRSGGYANPINSLITNFEVMIPLAKFLVESVEGFESQDHWDYLAENALEAYQDERMAELASPRIERIEA